MINSGFMSTAPPQRTFFHVEILIEVEPQHQSDLIAHARKLDTWEKEDENPETVLQNAVHNIIDWYVGRMMVHDVPIDHMGTTTSKPIHSSRKRAPRLIDNLLGIPLPEESETPK
jgi:hypothetical protein